MCSDFESTRARAILNWPVALSMANSIVSTPDDERASSQDDPVHREDQVHSGKSVLCSCKATSFNSEVTFPLRYTRVFRSVTTITVREVQCTYTMQDRPTVCIEVE